MKYYIKTFGCQMNHSDSERIAGFLEIHKIKPAKDTNQADLVIFNTCGVRQSAEDRVYGQIHNLHKRNPKVKIVLTGCLANRKDVRRRLRKKVDLFCEIKNFPEKIEKFVFARSKATKQSRSNKDGFNSTGLLRYARNDEYLKIIPKHTNNYQAFVPVMTGCNNFCSYCVVPYARGKEISRPANKIISEVRTLIKKGCKEIILLGQNVNSYKDRNINFSKLLKKVNDIPGDFWISFISNHPKDFSNELIEATAKLKKVCEYVHLPVQSGSNKILKKMNRKYTSQKYLDLINKIRKSFKKYKPGKLYAITSDIIVGFPGETRKQFLESAEIMKKVGYDMVYFGQFSPRPGTAAWKMKDIVSKFEKEKREKHLNEILKKTALENNYKYIGKSMDIFITNKRGRFYFGHTRTFKNVKITGKKENLAGKIVKTKITKANIWNLEGSFI